MGCSNYFSTKCTFTEGITEDKVVAELLQSLFRVIYQAVAIPYAALLDQFTALNWPEELIVEGLQALIKCERVGMYQDKLYIREEDDEEGSP